MRKLKIIVMTCMLSFTLSTFAGASVLDSLNTSYKTTRMVKDDYVFVVDSVKGAIGDRGIKINGVNFIGKMLHRTASAVGATKHIYKYGQAYNFCSSTLSRATMEADPHNIAFCPYIITIYELLDEPGNVYITYRKPVVVGNAASKKSLKAIGDLLDGIVKDALE
ncbi:MAG: DUF302 domain-containing protein [Gammaproteobacteria bacterium]|nr:DUF302 domain-containing protein [Gammaproteobacteria bacterium]